MWAHYKREVEVQHSGVISQKAVHVNNAKKQIDFQILIQNNGEQSCYTRYTHGCWLTQ